MKRLIKLLISLAVRGWDIGRTSVLRVARLEPPSVCVVLYYHGVGATQRERFARQMDELLRLSKPIRADLRGAPDGGQCYCAVTFDDGFVSVLENALPELERRHIPATMFVPTGSMGGKPSWIKDPAASANHEVVLSAAQLASLKERKLVTIGSHSVSHPDLREVGEAEADRELRESKADLEAIFGRRVTLFSFPHGTYDERLIELAKAAGYEQAFTIESRPAALSGDGFVIGRISASPDDWGLEFKLKLLGAYRWLAAGRSRARSSAPVTVSAGNRMTVSEIQVDGITREAWDNLTERFADATLYQSWTYGAVHWGTKQLSHIVVREASDVVGLAQVRLIRFPLGLGGIAYVTRGPLWRRKGLPGDVTRLERVLAALHEEYCIRRRCYLRVIPQIYRGDEAAGMEPLLKMGFQCRGSPYRTLLVDLSLSMEELRAGARPSWRQCLNKAEGNGFEIAEGTDDRLFEEVLAMHEQMHRRKQYAEFVNAVEFRRMQQMLSTGRKLRMLVCRKDGQPVAGVVWAAFGDTGLPLFGGTGDRALGADASYPLHWRLLQAMKERGLRYCDLGGINPDRNPGSYTFKTGMAKKTGKDVRLIGEFDACRGPMSRAVFHMGMGMRERYRSFRLLLEERRDKRRRNDRPRAHQSDTVSPSEQPA